MKYKHLFHYSLVMIALMAMPIASTTAAETSCEGKQLVVFGDSLVAGYGLKPGLAYPEQLAKELQEKGYGMEVVNAGVSGDTTSGGLARLDWSLGEKAAAVILELGANDALRGIPADKTRENLDRMIETLKARNIEVLLAGMMAPPNMGEAYGKAFNSIYPELAEKHGIDLYPFFLDGVAAEPELNQPDGIHPTEEGISLIVSKTLEKVEALVGRACKAEG